MSDAGLVIAALLGIPALLWALIKLYCLRAERQRPYPPHVNSAAQIRLLNTRRHERDPEATEIFPPVDDPGTAADPGWSPRLRWPGVIVPGGRGGDAREIPSSDRAPVKTCQDPDSTSESHGTAFVCSAARWALCQALASAGEVLGGLAARQSLHRACAPSAAAQTCGSPGPTQCGFHLMSKA